MDQSMKNRYQLYFELTSSVFETESDTECSATSSGNSHFCWVRADDDDDDDDVGSLITMRNTIE